MLTPSSSEKKPRPGSMVLRVFREPRQGDRFPQDFLQQYPAGTARELAGLVRKRLREGIDPRRMMLVKYDGEAAKIRWVPDEWKKGAEV